MEFRVLGPLEVIDGGRSLALGGHKQGALLAALLIHANEVVPADRLIDAVWGDDTPQSAANTLQAHVSKLRKVLGSSGRDGGGVLVTRAPGYQLRVRPDEVDMLRFEHLVEDGRQDHRRGTPERSAATLREALRLWRGPAFADFSYEAFAQPTIQRLEELRASALEDRVEADLALGRHVELVPELQELVAASPLRERLRGQLMLATYRSGNQAEALHVFEETRRVLRDELGVDPGPPLQRLHRAIIAHATELELATVGEARPRPALALDAPVSEAAETGLGEETRRTVTVVFSDVVGSTSLSASLDPEALRQVLTQYFQEVQAVFERHGGTVEKFIGDAVVAVFGLPRASEDDALRAIRSAAEARGDLERLNEELERDRGVRLQVRTGVSTGEVVAGDATTRQAIVTGTPVNLAARLQQAAEPQEILIDAQTHELVRDAFVGERVGPLDLKGIGTPTAAYRLAHVIAGVLGRERPRPPLVGRKRELAELGEAFEQVTEERRCRLLTVIGSAGVGKSRLVDEFIEGFAVSGRPLRGRCLPYGEGITFWPIVEIVRQAVGINERQSAKRMRERIAVLVADDPHGATITERVGQLVGIPEAEAVAQETYWAVRRFLESLGRRGPLVVLIDDLQWAEPNLLDLLQDLVARMTDVPILILCLARPEFTETTAGWLDDEHSAQIRLEPLDDDEGRDLLRSLLGAAVAVDVEDRIVRAAEGNPLFLEESVSMLIESGSLRPSDTGWVSAMDPMMIPLAPGVHAVLAARLDGLPPEERAVIARASVIGEIFYWGAVAALSPDDIRADVGQHLRRLVQKRLIKPVDSDLATEDAFRFHHILMRDVAYQGITKVTRARLHEQVADWISTAAGERTTEYEEIVAYHLEQAYRARAELGITLPHDREIASRAADALAAASRRALGRGDPLATLRLLERAARLLADDDPHRPAINLGISQAYFDLGALSEAIAAANKAAEDESAERALATMADLQLLSLRLRAEPEHVVAKDVAEAASRAIATFEEIGDDEGLAWAWNALAYAWHGMGRFSRSREGWIRAAWFAQRANQLRVEMDALGSQAFAMLMGPTPIPEAIDVCHEILDRGRGNQMLEQDVLGCLAILEAQLGRFTEARELDSSATAIARELGLTREVALRLWRGGQIEWLAERLASAEQHMREARDHLIAIGDRSLLASLLAQLAHVVSERGRRAEALRLTDMSQEAAAADDLDAQISWRTARAEALSATGDITKSEVLAREAMRLAEETDSPEYQTQALTALTEALRVRGREAEARSVAERALLICERKGNVVRARRIRALLDGLGARPR